VSPSTAASLTAQGATALEAAAIVAAIERFARDTAPSPAPARPARADRWQRAARLEDAGTGGEELLAWGDPHPWGRTAD
jgi:hypothetical protein